jgi:hypothetical protein
LYDKPSVDLALRRNSFKKNFSRALFGFFDKIALHLLSTLLANEAMASSASNLNKS